MCISSLLMVMSWFLLMSIRNRVCVSLTAFLSVVFMWSCGIVILMVVMFWFLIQINIAMEENVMIKGDVFYVYWLSFKDGCKQICSCTYPDRCSAEDAALHTISMYDGLDVLFSDYPFYVGCYEY